MNSNVKTDKTQLFCVGCEEFTDKFGSINDKNLCVNCDDRYDNKTGHCSLSCCLGYGCDEVC